MTDGQLPQDTVFQKSVVRYSIGGIRLDVPLGYHWSLFMRHGRWPSPKLDYQESKGFTLHALLPSFDPYSEKTRADFDNKVGHGDIVDILVQPFRLRAPLQDIFRNLDKSGRLVQQRDKSTVSGLVHYVDNRLSKLESDWLDIYVPESGLQDNYWIECSRRSRYPACKAYDRRMVVPFSVDYSYARDHLSQWQYIQERATDLIAGFIVKNADRK